MKKVGSLPFFLLPISLPFWIATLPFELPTLQNDCKYDMAISSEFPGKPKKCRIKPPRP